MIKNEESEIKLDLGKDHEESEEEEVEEDEESEQQESEVEEEEDDEEENNNDVVDLDFDLGDIGQTNNDVINNATTHAETVEKKKSNNKSINIFIY